MAIMDGNQHLQPDYNAKRNYPQGPSEEELRRWAEEDRAARRADLERQRQASRGGVDRSRMMERYGNQERNFVPESYDNYIQGEYSPEYYNLLANQKVMNPNQAPAVMQEMAYTKGLAEPFADDWSKYSASGSGVVPIDDWQDRTKENGWFYDDRPETERNFGDRRWAYSEAYDQRLPKQSSMDKLQGLYEKAMGYFR